MEDMARLAVVEQSVRDYDKFNKILYELLRIISRILADPHDLELRTLKSDILKDLVMLDGFKDYLKHIGFKTMNSKFVYPKERSLSRLRMAQAALERKISFCYGIEVSKLSLPHPPGQGKRLDLAPVNILTTSNPLLLKMQDLFNHVLQYEDEELQELAREQIPLVKLQLMALDRVREQQKKIKTGETKEQDLPFDVALLMELLGWFKYKFFTWVDQPACEKCGGQTTLKDKVTVTSEGETCVVEVYKCTVCVGGGARFPRYNRAATVLRTRRGRCGEWANAFTLLCRALGYDTRYVYDSTDHVWCEVYDYDSKSWLHADPCEGILNAPLIYEHGWGKRLSYVIAASRDDIQDVTWRYTLDHKQTLSRRTSCSESSVVSALVSLRGERQRHLPSARCNYLARRTLAELVQLMEQRKPSDYESHGRISGSKQWRSERGEVGRGHTFELCRGPAAVSYCAGTDNYTVSDGADTRTLHGWLTGVYHAENVFRKVENDWKKVYLAREEGESFGSVSWRFVANGGQFKDVVMTATMAEFDTGKVSWTVQCDEGEFAPLYFDESGSASINAGACSRSVTVRATVSGGGGARSWQHAQLFRADLADTRAGLCFRADIQH